MDRQSDRAAPVVEPSPDATGPLELTQRTLRLRIRQQEILAELGVLALQRPEFSALLAETVRLTAEGLETEFCKVMEYLPGENRFLVRAGVGWGPGVVGTATIGADLESPAGYSLRTGRPVISNHLENEERFRTPALLVEYGIRRAMNVILQGDGSPFGVLEVDSRSDGEFNEDDVAFLQGVGSIVGMAIERQRYERDLRAALDRYEVLLKELNHRTKNSLHIVATMLQMQARSTHNPELRAQLQEAAMRVVTVGRAYERLAYDGGHQNVDLGVYLREVANDLEVAPNRLHFSSDPGITFASDRAILLGLIINELVTNAAKYAYPGGATGPIRVSVTRIDEDTALVSVRDDGVGLPTDFNLEKGARLGSRLVGVFTKQLAIDLSLSSSTAGTEFLLRIPMHPA